MKDSNDIVPLRTKSQAHVFKAPFVDNTNLFGSGALFTTRKPVSLMVRTSLTGVDIPVCGDSGCGPVIAQRSWVTKHLPNAVIRTNNNRNLLKVRAGYAGDKIDVLPDFVCAELFLVTVKGDMLAIQVEIHITDLVIDSGLLLGSIAFTSNQLVLDFDGHHIRSKALLNDTVPIYAGSKRDRQAVIAQPIRAMKTTYVALGYESKVPIEMKRVPSGRSFLFTPHNFSNDSVGELCRAPAGLIYNDQSAIPVANFSEKGHVVKRGTLLGHIAELSDKDCLKYVASPSDIPDSDF